MTKRRKKRFTIDTRVLDVPLVVGVRPSLEELLTQGTAQERREALWTIGMLLRSRHALPQQIAELVGSALVKISDGKTAEQAFGLNTKKRYGVRYRKAIEYMVEDLVRQGATREEAEEVVGDLNFEAGTWKEQTDKHGRSRARKQLRKRLKRASE